MKGKPNHGLSICLDEPSSQFAAHLGDFPWVPAWARFSCRVYYDHLHYDEGRFGIWEPRRAIPVEPAALLLLIPILR